MLPAPPHDHTGHTWHHADDQLFEIVDYGPSIAMGDLANRSMMPAFVDALSDDEIVSVLLYLRSTWAAEYRDFLQGANDANTGRSWWRDKQPWHRTPESYGITIN